MQMLHIPWQALLPASIEQSHVHRASAAQISHWATEAWLTSYRPWAIDVEKLAYSGRCSGLGCAAEKLDAFTGEATALVWPASHVQSYLRAWSSTPVRAKQITCTAAAQHSEGAYLGSVQVLVQQQQQVARHQLGVRLVAQRQEGLLSCPVSGSCVAPATPCRLEAMPEAACKSA